MTDLRHAVVLTWTQHDVYQLLREHGPMTSGQVAAFLWPDSKGWCRSGGRGVQGLARAAAGVLYRLKRKGKAEVDLTRVPALWRAR